MSLPVLIFTIPSVAATAENAQQQPAIGNYVSTCFHVIKHTSSRKKIVLTSL
jgi:hypothetical protein